MPKRFGKDLLQRWEGNPALSLEDIPFPCNSVFNGTPAKLGDEDYVLLLRLEGKQGHSILALARSTDGLHWRMEQEPVMVRATEEPFRAAEALGIEDPRATYIDAAWHLLYTAHSPQGTRIAVARTQDFHHFERLAVISPPGNKDGVLFPDKISGEYVRLDRPIGNGIGSIWISYSKDMMSWGKSRALLTPRPGYWDSYRIGASAPPIRTKHGWLEIYHGSKMYPSGPVYRAGSALLALDDPCRVIARSSMPLISPREIYERIGDIPNVVFASGAIVEPDGEVKLYYGAADTCICVAMAHIDDIIDYTFNHPES